MSITERRMYAIGEVARILNCSADTLHDFEKRQVLAPEERRGRRGARTYSFEQVVAIAVCLRLREVGLVVSRLPPVAACVAGLSDLSNSRGPIFVTLDATGCRRGDGTTGIGVALRPLAEEIRERIQQVAARRATTGYRRPWFAPDGATRGRTEGERERTLR